MQWFIIGVQTATLLLNMRLLSTNFQSFCGDPLDLQSRDRGLLDEDFGLLGNSPAAGAMWIEAMETAISAAEHSRRKSQRDRSHLRRRTSFNPSFSYAPKVVVIVPIKDSEGSICYKRRRRRS